MSKLTNYNGHYCESEFENAFITYLEQVGWTYTQGDKLARKSKLDVLIEEDFKNFISKTNTDLTTDEVAQLYDTIRLTGAETHFATLHKLYGFMVNDVQFTPQSGQARMIPLIDYKTPENNIFRVVNQFTVEYTNQGQKENRRPDVLLYVNGMPLCVIELKNPANAHATIHDAYEQITIRYWRDIPHLLHYCPLACISDGVKTRLGTVRTPYEHFYAWRRVNDGDKVSTLPFEETKTMIQGVYAPARFLEIFRDYVYFQDTVYDNDEKEIVCRYPQFFATRLLKESIIQSVQTGTRKGGTYFGATGCGKTYTMAFLARQLALRCTDVPEMGSPTVVMIVDREDLQNQGAKLFTKSTEFLNLGAVSIVPSRKKLREELGARESGGFYICTIQKFCDRKEDKIGLINSRRNIICFSDEAHRTQIEHSKQIQFSKDADENMKAMVSKPYAKVLQEAFPNATFVGFTGTPIAETYQTFGEEIDRYTMDQAVADGLTVPIKYAPRIAKVLLDTKKVKEIERYYKACAEEGATQEDIEASKKAMSSMEIILGEQERLERLAVDIHDHYTAACDTDPDRVQKAMIVCANRTIAFDLLQTFQKKYPEWFVEKKTADGVSATAEQLRKLKPMPFMAMVASVGSNDPEKMYNYLGGVKNDQRSSNLDTAFKQDLSNFHIVIVVDMWITGFDVSSLTYMYNDKPLQKHQLIQTISRVNRKHPGKEYGLIVDYIGIRDNMREALKIYGGSTTIAPHPDDIEQATLIFREALELLKRLFVSFDLTPFLNPETDPATRYELLAKAAEYIFASTEEMNTESRDGKKVKKVAYKTYFLQVTRRMRAAYDICQPSGNLQDEESALAQCFMAVAGFIRKMNGSSHIDADTMNRKVEKMVEEALKYNKVESMLEVGETQAQATNDIIQNATEQALALLEEMNEDRNSFRKLGLTFEEKAFYDILLALRDQYNFEYGEDKEKNGIVVNEKCKKLAQKVKEIIDTKSSFADWLNNQNVRDKLKYEIKVCLVQNGYPPQYSPEVFTKVMEQVENFEENM